MTLLIVPPYPPPVIMAERPADMFVLDDGSRIVVGPPLNIRPQWLRDKLKEKK